MYESDMRDGKKITVFPGNILTVKSHLLVLYEVKAYSQAHKRISATLDYSNSHKNEIYGDVNLFYYRTRDKLFKSLCVIDSTRSSEANIFKLMEKIYNFLNPLLMNTAGSGQMIVSFNLTDQQDTENLKYLIDKFISGARPLHAYLVGTPLNTNHMLSHLNQSGHLLTNSSIEMPALISNYFNHIICHDCKRIDLNSKTTADFSKLYCKTCAPLHGAFTTSKFAKKCMSFLKERCYCKTDYKLADREKHLKTCTTAVFCCEKCDYYSGQRDFAKHYVMEHSKEVFDKMDDMWKRKIDRHVKAQCNKCGNFYQQDGKCSVCLEKELRAKLQNK